VPDGLGAVEFTTTVEDTRMTVWIHLPGFKRKVCMFELSTLPKKPDAQQVAIDRVIAAYAKGFEEALNEDGISTLGIQQAGDD
jgi:hypothetical protein